MPTYEYECGSCKHRFDLRQSFNDKPQAVCPKCKKKAKRVFHPAPIIFKGSGFYVTDHSSANPASTTKTEKTETKKASEPASAPAPAPSSDKKESKSK
jgi:putative FmdB family regulatory protein